MKRFNSMVIYLSLVFVFFLLSTDIGTLANPSSGGGSRSSGGGSRSSGGGNTSKDTSSRTGGTAGSGSQSEGDDTNIEDIKIDGSLGDRLNLPDLVIHGLSLTDDCSLVITVKNIGSGQVPDSAWSIEQSIVDLEVDGGGWNGFLLRDFDQQKQLQPPGGMITVVTEQKVSNTAFIEVQADRHDMVTETSGHNNGKTETLTCQ